MVNVVDGDTIDVTLNGREYRVRYIGIDTPETVQPTRGIEPYGKDASARDAQLVEGSMVNATRVAKGYAQEEGWYG